MNDRFGLGFRPELAAGIISHLDEIDVIEVIADDYFNAPASDLRPLQLLRDHVPMVLHGVSMGMASVQQVDDRRLRAMRRLVDEINPECWSEHLAFVRAGSIEIGHLTAPPRTQATIEGTLRNLARAESIVGTLPHMENIATMFDPPQSELSEADWIRDIVSRSGCGLLLDLHNILTNAFNLGYDQMSFLDAIPLHRVTFIHVAGGQWIEKPGGGTCILDDHLHDIPEPVFDLLYEVGRRVDHQLTVLLERDGEFPPMEQLLNEIRRCREVLARARAGKAVEAV